MQTDLEQILTDEVREKMRAEIRRARSNEVFFVLRLDEKNSSVEVIVAARGNKNATVACLEIVRLSDWVIHNHPAGALDPSDADLEVSSVLATLGAGSAIVDNRIQECYVVVEPRKVQTVEVVTADEIHTVFSSGGQLERGYDGYESRPAQEQMACEIADGFNHSQIVLAEGGPGIGKTFAYLVPTLLWSEKNAERVVISTHTIALQEQIVFKDIPALERVLEMRIPVALVRGRGNYICLRKLQHLKREPDLFGWSKDGSQLEFILEWVRHSSDGSRSDLNMEISEELWDRVRSETETCLRLRCPSHSKCFYYRMRREAALARLLVVNHHVLCADLEIRHISGEFSESVLLPPYRCLIVDEAHQLEDSATSYLTHSLNEGAMLKWLRRLEVKELHRESGLLAYLKKKYHSEEALVHSIEVVEPLLGRLAATIHESFRSWHTFFQEAAPENKEGKAQPLRLSADALAHESFDDKIVQITVQLKDELSRLLIELENVKNQIAKQKTKTVHEDKTDLDGLIVKGEFFHQVIMEASSWADEDRVRWLEPTRSKSGEGVDWVVAPIQCSRWLKEVMFEKCASAVLTSATLTAEENFDFLKSQVGLSDTPASRLREAIFPSPFHYDERVFLGIFSELPPPQEPEFNTVLPDLVVRAVSLSEGRAFVLFTSYQLMEQVARQIRWELAGLNLELLKQGGRPSRHLLDEFRREENRVLFGTDSFWEGVDVKGERLVNVLITRLPFKVPTEPLSAARSERLAEQGKSPFYDYFVPKAAIKLKQGFGRLIRHHEDWGSVLIFDSRLVRKEYGVRLLRSLPKCYTVVGSQDKVFQALSEFYTHIKSAFLSTE